MANLELDDEGSRLVEVSQSEVDAWADDLRALGSSGDYFIS